MYHLYNVHSYICIYSKRSSDLYLSIQDCSPNSDLNDPGRELKCIFPKIPAEYLDDIINGSLELTYSLVAASVPGLDNLHLMLQFVFVFVDDPVITPFNGTISYHPGSSMSISVTVSVYSYVRTYVYNVAMCIVYPIFRGQILMWLKTVNCKLKLVIDCVVIS